MLQIPLLLLPHSLSFFIPFLFSWFFALEYRTVTHIMAAFARQLYTFVYVLGFFHHRGNPFSPVRPVQDTRAFVLYPDLA